MALIPIAYQVGHKAVLCSTSCLMPNIAQMITDALDGEDDPLGDIHPWTVDLYPGDNDLRCDSCGRLLVTAPVVEQDE